MFTFWLLIEWLSHYFGRRGKHYRSDLYSFKTDYFTSATGCLKVGIFHFWVLYIGLHCVNILYLYIENTLSIYRKVALGFSIFFTVSNREAYTFDSFEFYKCSFGSIISAIGGKPIFLLWAVRLDKSQRCSRCKTVYILCLPSYI